MAGAFNALFDAVRPIPAADAAERLNIELHRRGSRAVACCPMHGEDHPSMVFYPDGRFFCFGCSAHGGAIELYQQVLNLSPLEAARALAADFNIVEPARGTPVPPRVPTAHDLKRALDKFKGKTWGALCERKHAAKATASAIFALLGDPTACAETKAFWAAVRDAAGAEDELFQLEDVSPAQLLALAKGAKNHV